MDKKILIAGVVSLLAFNTYTYSQSHTEFTVQEISEASSAARASGDVSEEEAIMTSSSAVDWTTFKFNSSITLDTQKAGIKIPSGKVSSINKIKANLPLLIKDPLLSLYVDNSKTLSDVVMDNSISIAQLTNIMDRSETTPVYFESGTSVLKTTHSIDLREIGNLLVKHKDPYTITKPIDSIASRAYTGIIIDARGKLSVQGEFIKSPMSAAFFPKIWNEKMDLMYERNMVDPKVIAQHGMVTYGDSIDIGDYKDIVGTDPLWITAKKVYGINRVDPVISYDDYLRIVTVDKNLELLKNGKIVIILDKNQLTYNVSAPEKSRNFYLNYQRLKRYVYENKVPDTVVDEAPSGMQITMQNLNFIADSSDLIPSEIERVAQIAAALKDIVSTGDYTILVEGHTADVNKPEGQMNLSIQRAQSIVNALIAQGLDASLFTCKGYGGTKPVADNSTAQGRAENRRVEITVMPKSSYIQRQ